tara:strand:- start:20328 stop:20432 length:105 start_codon:yes stop_codon:yes gene_type:complete
MKWILIIFGIVSAVIILSSIVVTIKDTIKDFRNK